jgi:hypothetical protein
MVLHIQGIRNLFLAPQASCASPLPFSKAYLHVFLAFHQIFPKNCEAISLL